MGFKARKAKRLHVVRERYDWADGPGYAVSAEPKEISADGFADYRDSDVLVACPTAFEEATGIKLNPGERCVIEVKRVK